MGARRLGKAGDANVNRPVMCSRKTQQWAKLPNSGDTLMNIVPNYCLKIICGWIN